MIESIGLRVVTNRVRRTGASLVALAAAFAAAVLLQTPAWAGESFTWTGEGHDGIWTNSCNWHPKNQCKQTYPGMGATDDEAIIERTASAPAHVQLGEDVTLASLQIRGEGVSLTGGGVTVTRSFNWTGGDINSEVSLDSGSSGVIDGGVAKALKGTIQNRGRLTLGPVPLNIGGGAKINNFNAFSVMQGARITGMTCCVDPPEINTAGTFTVSSSILPGSDHVTVENVSFNAGGTVKVGKGTLELRAAPGQINAGTKFSGDGKVRITNRAQMQMLGTFNVSPDTEFELASATLDGGQGELQGRGAMQGKGRFLWTGGSVAGDLTLGSEIGTAMEGPSIKDLDGSLTNLGRLVFYASRSSEPPTGQLRFGSRAQLNNQGIFIAQEGVGMAGTICCNSPATFDNTGHFTVGLNGTREPGTVTVSNILFRAGGSVHLERGTLELRRGPGVLASGVDITGAGALSVTDLATMELTGPFNLAPETTLELGSCSGECGMGRLAGSGTLRGGGRFDWLGGVVGANLTIARGSDLTVSGTAAKELQGTITNRGEAHFVSNLAPAPASGPIMFVGPAKFINAGTFAAGDRSVFRGTVCCVNPAKFINLQTGKFVMSRPLVPSTGTVSMGNMAFENAGRVEVASGKLLLGAGGYTQLSGSTRLTGGSIETTSLLDIRGGSLAGKGTITGNLQNSGGTVAPGAPDSAGSTGIIKVVGDYRQEPAGTLNIDLKGSTPGRGFDQLQVSEEAVLAGTLDLDTATGYNPGPATQLKVLTMSSRVGTFERLVDPRLPNGRKWSASYNPTDVTLRVRRT